MGWMGVIRQVKSIEIKKETNPDKEELISGIHKREITVGELRGVN